jgi:hypothetical protein
MNQAADVLREIYYGGSSSIDDSDDHNMMKVIVEKEQASRKEFDVVLEEMEGAIKILTATMIHCIQKMYVGNLRGQALPDEKADTTTTRPAKVKKSSASSTKNGEEYL